MSPPSYPPEPWTLVGRMDLSTFLVPARFLDHVPWPAGYSAAAVAGRVPVGAAWVHYGSGGTLAYRELLVTALARRGGRVVPHVTDIWVDSPASRDGGRALWGIPKDLAAFAEDDLRPSCTPEGAGAPAASAVVRHGRRVPGRRRLGFSIVQTLADGRVLTSPVRTRAGLGLASIDWTFDPDGPLGHLAGRRPLASSTLHDFAMLFGMTPTDRDRQAGAGTRPAR